MYSLSSLILNRLCHYGHLVLVICLLWSTMLMSSQVLWSAEQEATNEWSRRTKAALVTGCVLCQTHYPTVIHETEKKKKKRNMRIIIRSHSFLLWWHPTWQVPYHVTHFALLKYSPASPTLYANISCVNFQFVPFWGAWLLAQQIIDFARRIPSNEAVAKERGGGPLTFRTHNTNNTLSPFSGKSSCQSIQLDHVEHIIIITPTRHASTPWPCPCAGG